jgi:nucleoside-diphosphate-sugar epimerase
VTKLGAERHLADKNAIIFRLGTLFGVGDLFSRIRLDLIVNTLTVRAYLFGKITVYGGEQFRPLLHVRDAAHAIIENLDTEHIGVFNLHKQNVRIIDLAYQIRNHFPDLFIEQTEREFEDTRNYRVSSDKAVNILQFRPNRSIDEGIEEIKALLTSGRLRDVDNPRYTNQKFLSMYNTHIKGY